MTAAEPCLSVVMPCFNERGDHCGGRRCGARIALHRRAADRRRRLHRRHPRDPGHVRRTRGWSWCSSPRTGARAPRSAKASARATQPVVIVQDADLEYDPAEFGTVIQPILDGKADVVFGSRFLSGHAHRVLYFWHSVGNKLLDHRLQHVHQPEPHRHGDLLQGVPARGDPGHHPRGGPLRHRAGDDGQARRRSEWRIFEVGISYSGRTYAEGKKIGWRDGIRAIFCIVAYSPVGQRWKVKRLEPRRARPHRRQREGA